MHEDRAAEDLARCIAQVVAQTAEDIRRLGAWVEQHAAEDLGTDWVQAENELGHDTEVASAATQPPEELRVRGVVHRDRLAGGGDELRADQVVGGQSVDALQPAAATAEDEARHSRGRHPTAGRGQSVRLGGAVELAPHDAGLHAYDPGHRVDLDAVHGTEVEEQTTLDRRIAGDGVAASADGDRQAIRAGIADRVGHIGGTGRPGDHSRPAVEHGVVRDTGSVVGVTVGGSEDRAREAGAQPVQVESGK